MWLVWHVAGNVHHFPCPTQGLGTGKEDMSLTLLLGPVWQFGKAPAGLPHLLQQQCSCSSLLLLQPVKVRELLGLLLSNE